MQLPCASISLTCWNADVYEPSDDSFLLADAVKQQAVEQWHASPPQTVVEIGCGSGYVICSVALMLKHLGLHGQQLLAVDHSSCALQATQQTLASHGLQGSVELLQSDLTGAWHSNLKHHVDLLLFNPPYVPTPDEELAGAGTTVTSAWAGGHAGRRVIDRLLPQVCDLLSPGGQLLMVTVSENDPQGIIAEMTGKGLTGKVVAIRQADEETLSIVQLQRPIHS
mmetsp:Transcript_5651/g.9859  ORF Transcript_5651/g.9859 Transcript_5651/m.9859 type:complete len:224 (+) Transcript_5651:80-751(+)